MNPARVARPAVALAAVAAAGVVEEVLARARAEQHKALWGTAAPSDDGGERKWAVISDDSNVTRP
jgi:hypothetical protein